MKVALNATEYVFHGEGIAVSYFPQGAGGPLIKNRPEAFFFYQDRHCSKSFAENEVEVQQIENVGALVSVQLASGEIDGSPVTTFTVLIPSVGVTPESPQSFKTKSITTIQAAAYVERQTFSSRQTYTVDHLDGTASIHPLPA